MTESECTKEVALALVKRRTRHDGHPLAQIERLIDAIDAAGNDSKR